MTDRWKVKKKNHFWERFLNKMVFNQITTFLIFIAVGMVIANIFDVFRSLRKCMRTNNLLTNIEDIIFALTVGAILIFSLIKFNFGELRFYLFIAVVTGITLYYLFFSKIFMKISTTILNFIKKTIKIVISKFIKTYNWLKKIVKFSKKKKENKNWCWIK